MAVIIDQSGPVPVALPPPQDDVILNAVKGKLTLKDVKDSNGRYAVSAIDFSRLSRVNLATPQIASPSVVNFNGMPKQVAQVIHNNSGNGQLNVNPAGGVANTLPGPNNGLTQAGSGQALGGNAQLSNASQSGLADDASFSRISTSEVISNFWNPAGAGNANARAQYLSAISGSQDNFIPDTNLRYGVNYYPPSLDFSSGHWTIGQLPNTNANAFAIVPGTYTGAYYRYGLWFYLTAGTYTLSVVGAGSSAISSGYVYAGIYAYTIGTGLGSAQATVAFGVGKNADGRYSATFTVATSGYFVYLVDTSSPHISGGNVYLGTPQVEPGSVMTGYRASSDTSGYALYQGSVPPTVPNAAFSYTSTTTTIDWSWSAFFIYRTDATQLTVPTGTKNYSGLTASTSYYFYVAWNIPNSAINWTGPFTSATAAEMSAIQLAYLIPLCNTGIKVTTPASGSGGGSGGGNKCFHNRTLIQTRAGAVFADVLDVGDEVLTPNGWQKIELVRHAKESDWVEIGLSSGTSVRVTPSHVLKLADGNTIHARELTLGTILQGDGVLLSVISLEAILKADTAVSLKVPGDWLYPQQGGLIHHNQNQKP